MRLKCLAVVAGTLLSSRPTSGRKRFTADPLPTVVVTGTRSEKTLDETPIRTEVVDRQEIERTHARTLKDALENVPGLQLREIHGKSGYEVTLQG
jgi:outer membrane receptor for ferrienterochelin and colicins